MRLTPEETGAFLTLLTQDVCKRCKSVVFEVRLPEVKRHGSQTPICSQNGNGLFYQASSPVAVLEIPHALGKSLDTAIHWITQ